MRACQQIIGLDQEDEPELQETSEEEEEEEESQVDLRVLAPVKRKSCGGVSQLPSVKRQKSGDWGPGGTKL